MQYRLTKDLEIVSASFLTAPDADWCSSRGDLLTEEILEAHSALENKKKKKI